MTTPSTDAEHLRWWQWIGPWPLRPLALGLLAGLFAVATRAYSLNLDTAPSTLGSAIAVGAATGLTTWAIRRFTPALAARLPGFLIALTLIALIATIARVTTQTSIDFANFGTVGNFVFAWGRSIAFAIVILALLGSSQRRLQQQIDRADAALTVSQAQTEALLAADEEVRHQVSLLLHDRVQAGLIAACLQLRRTLGSDEVRDEQVRQVVDHLEQLRALDVRRAVHALSPNLRELDLLTALDELADTYRPAMTIDIEVADETAIPEPLRLGIYRIVEQALLNAAVHGQAKTCHVAVTAATRELTVEITDDGVGLPAQSRPGFGSTLIDTWCRALGGTWSRTVDSPGTRVRVALPTA